MFNSAIVEISGRQYKILPDTTLKVDYLGDIKTFECEKVLFICENGEILIGDPYLKKKLVFEVLGKEKKKIRVATYKAKANTRKTKGSLHLTSVIKLQSKTVKTDKAQA